VLLDLENNGVYIYTMKKNPVLKPLNPPKLVQVRFSIKEAKNESMAFQMLEVEEVGSEKIHYIRKTGKPFKDYLNNKAVYHYFVESYSDYCFHLCLQTDPLCWKLCAYAKL
jgi:hypothetical protein